MQKVFCETKKERIYGKKYVTMEKIWQDMFRHIKLLYNRKRQYSVVGYMNPVEYRMNYATERVA